MDLENQAAIKSIADEIGVENLMVVLGMPGEGLRLAVETLTTGDPSWAGPLAGVSLGLPVFHILEEQVRAQVPEEVYADKLLMMENGARPAADRERPGLDASGRVGEANMSMRLEMGLFPVSKIIVGKRFAYKDETLTVDADELRELALEDGALKSVHFDAAMPGDSARITNVLDAVEPIYKVSGALVRISGVSRPGEDRR